VYVKVEEHGVIDTIKKKFDEVIKYLSLLNHGSEERRRRETVRCGTDVYRMMVISLLYCCAKYREWVALTIIDNCTNVEATQTLFLFLSFSLLFLVF